MNRFLTVLIVLMLAACNKQEQSGETVSKPEQSITEAVHQPLERAKGVEQTLQQEADQRLKQTDGL